MGRCILISEHDNNILLWTCDCQVVVVFLCACDADMLLITCDCQVVDVFCAWTVLFALVCSVWSVGGHLCIFFNQFLFSISNFRSIVCVFQIISKIGLKFCNFEIFSEKKTVRFPSFQIGSYWIWIFECPLEYEFNLDVILNLKLISLFEIELGWEVDFEFAFGSDWQFGFKEELEFQLVLNIEFGAEFALRSRIQLQIWMRIKIGFADNVFEDLVTEWWSAIRRPLCRTFHRWNQSTEQSLHFGLRKMSMTLIPTHGCTTFR